MRIVKLFNNNVALAVDKHNKELIVMGKGICFGRKVGDEIDNKIIDKTFVLKEAVASGLEDLYKDLHPEVVNLVLKIVNLAETELDIQAKGNLYIALADHLNFSLQRIRDGIYVENPLAWEVRNFYPQEYAIGKQAIEMVSEETEIALPDSEATAIALHLVNEQMNAKNMNRTIKVTNIVKDILNIVRATFGIHFDEEKISYNRFVTHLKFFAQRVLQGKQQGDNDSFLFEQVKQSYPQAFYCALKIKDYASKIHHFETNQDELVYLAIHIQRIINQTN